MGLNWEKLVDEISNQCREEGRFENEGLVLVTQLGSATFFYDGHHLDELPLEEQLIVVELLPPIVKQFKATLNKRETLSPQIKAANKKINDLILSISRPKVTQNKPSKNSGSVLSSFRQHNN